MFTLLNYIANETAWLLCLFASTTLPTNVFYDTLQGVVINNCKVVNTNITYPLSNNIQAGEL